MTRTASGGVRNGSQEESDTRQQAAPDDSVRVMDAAIAELRAEVHSFAAQHSGARADRRELEALTSNMLRSERDARAVLTQSLEVERGGRVFQDLENERDA